MIARKGRMMSIDVIVRQVRQIRLESLRRLAAEIVANRETQPQVPVDLTVNVPPQNQVDPVINLPALVTDVNVTAPNVEIINQVETSVPDVVVNTPIELIVPTQPAPMVNVNVPPQQPQVNVQLVVPPDAIRVEVNIPTVKVDVPPPTVVQPHHPSPPKKAKITHSDGTVAKVELI